MKQMTVKCPYCHAPALLRPASFVYGAATKSQKDFLYVCSRWPDCDAYVGAHTHGLTPMGTLANGNLRHKRILAHKAFDPLWKSGRMTKKMAYLWLQIRLELNESQAHIGKFSEEMCDRVISICTGNDCLQRPAA